MNKTTEEIKLELIKNYKNSMHSANAREKIRGIKLCVSHFTRGHILTFSHFCCPSPLVRTSEAHKES